MLRQLLFFVSTLLGPVDCIIGNLHKIFGPFNVYIDIFFKHSAYDSQVQVMQCVKHSTILRSRMKNLFYNTLTCLK